LLWRGSQALCDDFPRGPSPEIAAEASVAKVEQRRIRVENRADGAVSVSSDRGATWRRLGTVLQPATAVNEMGYTASRWAADGSVAATAVNGVHVKVRHNTAQDRGVIFSIIPHTPSAVGAAARAPSSAIGTDIAPGTAIFGSLAPMVGNPVRIELQGRVESLPPGHTPTLGDVYVIVVERPVRAPVAAVFENEFGGLIYLEYRDGERKAIGTVLRPVVGVGRFPGTAYAGVGRIRANHCGVIDVSTSPYGEVGGFQIVPKGHAGSPETSYIRTETQWMVIGPISALDPSWEGIPPFFSSFLGPYASPDDLSADDWLERYLGRARVDVRRNGGDWERMRAYSLDPHAALPSWARDALKDVTHIRIQFSMWL
jgi:hypothetical protein